jgi:hypothetical protein
MSDKKDSLIDKSTLDILNKVKEGGAEDADVKEALEAINKTGQIMDNIISGRQIDLAFYKLFVAKSVRNLKKKTKSNKQ